jgi:signal transduction histidine kinase
LERQRELHELKSRFVSVVSHEFRNPLAVIQFALGMLNQKDEAILPEKKQLYIERAKESVRQMEELLEDVLLIGESEAGKLQCNPVSIDLAYFCRSLVEAFQIGVGAKHSIVFTTEQATDPPQVFYCFDGKLLHYILVNLLSNAVKYSPKQSDIRFNLICHADWVIFQIQDQGIGIPTEDQSHLFSSFHRGSNAKKIPGTGLGLSIVKQCIDAHGGTIDVESEEGIGTTVTVKLYQ